MTRFFFSLQVEKKQIKRRHHLHLGEMLSELPNELNRIAMAGRLAAHKSSQRPIRKG
jgi:hypothetical protein